MLAATDFSAPARHAADRDARLAHETGVPLTLVHVLPEGALHDLRQWLGSGHAIERQIRDEARQQLAQLATELHTSRHVAARPVNASGAVLAEIDREADAIDAALLVLGARGTGCLRRLALGSTSERLLRRTTRPLLVVRQMSHEPYRRALVALDFSSWSAQAIPLARHVAPHAHLLLFHAFQVPFEEKLRFAGVDATTIEHYRARARADATQRVRALAHAGGLKPATWALCIVEGEASQRIVEHEQEKDCDLVVLGKHGQSATEDLLWAASASMCWPRAAAMSWFRRHTRHDLAVGSTAARAGLPGAALHPGPGRGLPRTARDRSVSRHPAENWHQIGSRATMTRRKLSAARALYTGRIGGP